MQDFSNPINVRFFNFLNMVLYGTISTVSTCGDCYLCFKVAGDSVYVLNLASKIFEKLDRPFKIYGALW